MTDIPTNKELHDSIVEGQLSAVHARLGQMDRKMERIEAYLELRDEEWRRATCPWRDHLTDQDQALANGGRRFGSLDEEVDELLCRVATLERLAATRETQGGLLYVLFEWAWKLGVIALVLGQVARWLDGIPWN